MATKKEQAKIKITCANCNKHKVSWHFDVDDDGSYYDECKVCRPNDSVYICVQCENETPYLDMMQNRGNVQKKCKKCNSKKGAEYYIKNREAKLQTVKEYTANNAQKVKDYQKKYNYEHKEETKIYNKVYRKENKVQLRIQRKEYEQKPYVKIRHNLQSRLHKALHSKNVKKTNKTLELLGCDVKTFIKWMKFQFTTGMTMDNHGEWHMDHCQPCNSFDLMDESEQKKCFHWTNIQPMWGPENLSKSDKYTHKDLLFQEIKVAAFKIKINGTIHSDTMNRSLLIPPSFRKKTSGTSGKLDKTIIHQPFNLLTIELGEGPITVIDDMIGAW